VIRKKSIKKFDSMSILRLLNFLLFFNFLQIGFAQTDTLRVTLDEIIAMAQQDAPDVLLAKTRLSNRYWRYKSFQADYKPQIQFDATLPNLNRSIESLTLPDGTDAFINRSLMRNNVGFSLNQEIAATGGSIFVFSGLQRLDIFESATIPGFTSYLSTPFSVGFVQPLFGFNRLKWNKKLEPLRYEEAGRNYAEEMEAVAGQASVFFFDLLNAQLNLSASLRDKVNADTLFSISKGRFSVGKIAETDLLQVELSVMNADAALASARLNMQTSTQQLLNFLGTTQRSVVFDLVPPLELPDFLIDADLALNYARKFRSETVSFNRRIKEAEQQIAEAKGNNGPNINIRGSFGLTQTGNEFGEAYKSPLDQEQLSLTLQVPIADWGKARSEQKIAQSNFELEQMNVEQDRINFEREILLKVQQFDLHRQQVRLSLRAYEVAQKRQGITRKRYLIGKIALTDLNLAIREEDEARRSYIRTLQTFWLSLYELRQLCLYDFERDEPLFKTIEEF